MNSYTSANHRMVSRPVRRPPVISSPVLGMAMFIGTELMFFVALISAYLVIKAGTGNWIPPASVRLPIAATGFNTLVLLASGYLMWRAGKLYIQGRTLRDQARATYLRATCLGAFFVVFQGFEWIKLMTTGMTMTSSIFGACFFLLIGSHGLHAAATIVGLAVYYRSVAAGKVTIGGLKALQMFWLFVVGIWPILYALVYF